MILSSAGPNPGDAAPILSINTHRSRNLMTLPTILRNAVVVALVALALPSVARADKKEFLALTQQIAMLQGQVAEADQARLDAQKDLKRILDMLVEQSALVKKLQQDLKVQDERTLVGIKELQDRVSDVSDRLRTSSLQPPTGSSGLPAGPGATQSLTPSAPAIAPRDLYQQAYSDFARKNYELSIQGFQEYLRLYRDTELADNAQYWVGECLQAQGKYEDAVTAFNALLRDFIDSDKIPDARYKKGVALEALGRKSQAALEYRFVVERFPNSPAARLAREKLGQP